MKVKRKGLIRKFICSGLALFLVAYKERTKLTIYLSDHSTFTTKDELNENISLHLKAHKYDLNDTDRQVFNLLSRYSVKYLGASHLKMSTIADKLDKSRRTIQYSIKKLISLKMLQKISFMRKVAGGYGANLYVILPFDSSTCTSDLHIEDKPETQSHQGSEPQTDEKRPSNSKAIKSFLRDTYHPDLSHSQSDMCNQSISEPTTFYQAFCSRIRGFIHDAPRSVLTALYAVYRAQSIPLLKFSIYKDKQEQFEQLGLQAITITMQATKKKPIRNLTGFFSGVFKNLILKHIVELDESIPESDEPLEWFIPAHR